MALTILNSDKVQTFKRKIYIAYLYFKRYILWVFLALFLLLVVNILVKNMGQKVSIQESSKLLPSPIGKKLEVKVKPMRTTQSVSDSQLISLKQQLKIEKEKNKNFAKILNNQELQMISALDDINQSFKTFTGDTTARKEISVLPSSTTDQSTYYNKVKAALSKINTINKKEMKKLSTTNDENSQATVIKKEG
jgi:hypothetical protein